MGAVTSSATRGMAHGQEQGLGPSSMTKVKIYQAKKVYQQWLVYRRIRIIEAPSKSEWNLRGSSNK